MRTARLLVMLAMAAVLAACSLGRPLPPSTLYAIEPAPGAPAASRRSELLRVGSVRVVATFASTELVYRTDDVVYAQDFYNRLIAPPNGMLAARISDWLARSGPFPVVAVTGGAPAPYVLEAVFTELYGDFRPDRKAEAVVAAQFTLLRVSAGDARLVLARTLERRVELAERTPAALVRGYNAALGDMLRELSAAMAEATPK